MILLRYFSREVLGNTLGVSLVLLLIFLSQRFVKYLGSAAAGDIDPAVLLPLILYRIPGMLELILPLALFIALLLSYGRLYLDNEMRVIFAAGISKSRLLGVTFVPVVLLAIVVGGISLWLTPHSLAKVQNLLQSQEDRSELDSLSEGKFHSFRNDSGVIYVEKMFKKTAIQSVSVAGELIDNNPENNNSENNKKDVRIEKEMQGVYIFQQNESEGVLEEVFIVAEQGQQINNEDGRYLLLESGYRLQTKDGGQTFEKIDFSRYGQYFDVKTSLEYENLKVNALPTQALKNSKRADYRAAWQWRISLIFLVPVVALLAIAFGKADARQGRYFKILPAILVYLLYLVLLNMVKDHLSTGALMPINPFILVHAVFGLLGLLILFWEDIWRRWFYRPKTSQVFKIANKIFSSDSL